jgi:hypothetical protein
LVNAGRFVDRSKRRKLERRESFGLRHLGKDTEAHLVETASQVRGDADAREGSSPRPRALPWKFPADADSDEPLSALCSAGAPGLHITRLRAPRVVWRWLHRHAHLDLHLRWRFEKATPEPDFE